MPSWWQRGAATAVAWSSSHACNLARGSANTCRAIHRCLPGPAWLRPILQACRYSGSRWVIEASQGKRLHCTHAPAWLRTLGLVGHDRGSYTAFRTAMDHPDSVSRLAILDGIPIADALARCDARFASTWWHWFFFAQAEKPERAILADPDAWYGGSPEAMGVESYADFHSAIHDPETVHGMIEDYRAGLGIDRQHDEDDRSTGRKLACPLLVLWSARDDLEDLHGDILASGGNGLPTSGAAASTAATIWPKKHPKNWRPS